MTRSSLAGRVAAVTGAARGIGRAIATRLCGEGVHVVLQDVLADEVHALAEALTKDGRSVTSVDGDAGDPATAERLVAHAVQRFGRLDALVNNAAASVRRPLLELEPDEAESTFRATYWSAFHVTRHGARRMVEQGDGGAILMVSSVAAEVPIPAGGVYASAKAALEQLMRSFAMELAPYQIRVNAVAPGLIDTPGERTHNDAQLRLLGPRLALGRAGAAEEIAAAAAYLLSDEASYVTGSVLHVDGGLRLPQMRKRDPRP